MIVRTPTRRRRAVVIAAAMATVVLGAAACGGTGGDDGPSGTTGTTGPAAAAPVDYSTPGPYRVGTRELTIATDDCPEDPDGCPRQAVVYYPADPDAAAETARIEGYSTAVAFPPSVRAVVPSEFIQEIALGDVEVYDAPAANAEAPFPVVLHSHGFGSYYLFESRSMAHLASWGYVVAAPDHKERSLVGQLLGGGEGAADPDRDVRDLQDLLRTLRDRNVSDGVLKGALDFEELAVTGLSAGGSTAGRMIAADPTVDAYIGKAPVPPVAVEGGGPDLEPAERLAAMEEAFATSDPPGVPIMLIAGERDGVVPLSTVQATYDWLAAPKRLVVLTNAGHNAFTDLCAPIREQGGLMAYADQLPALAPVLELGEDGCIDGYLEPEAGEALVNHLLVAQLRWVFGFDATDVSLSSAYLEAQFPEAFGSEQADPTPTSP